MNFIEEFSGCIKDRLSYIRFHYNMLVYYYWFNDKNLTLFDGRILTDIDTSFFNTFVKFKLKCCKCTTTVVSYDFIVYDKKQVAVEIIIRYWKKYRWNYLKNLAEIKYHPSRLCFDV